MPDDALEHPKMYGGLRCHVPIPKDVIDELCAYLTEEVGLHEAYLSWYTDKFNGMAEAAYQSIGKPACTLENVWSIFGAMSEVLEVSF